MSDGIYKPNQTTIKRMEIPDRVRTKKGDYFNPNTPAPPRDPVPDLRPGVLLAQAGFGSAEEWGNAILAKSNGMKYVQQKGELGNDGLMRTVDDDGK